ncbi:molybdenum cofactor guanylyltransferase MobA [Onishia niordana]|uniref:molybdenum cofactor guanylyltransferase MobA n=1 Tax=Onishia niordana TaxID=2508711 RepID=UPI0010A0017C|nr:molybdenum cofactor guanylyltransferase MobA [Halomonas niordiana]
MTHDDVTGVILAGGQGRRMGGRDKGLEPFGSARLIEYAKRSLDGRVAEVLINANRHLDDYRALGCRVISDRESGYQGPLMGIWSGLEAAQTPWVVIVPCDSPALPDDLVARLIAAIGEADIAVAHDGERDHPVVALIRRDLTADLGEALKEGERKIDRWYARHVWTRADFSDCPAAFANLNTEDDKARLAQQLRAGDA